MNCKTVQNSLSERLDGCLPKEEREEVALHLARCRPCQARWEEMVRMRAAVRALPVKAAPAGLNTALLVIASRERARVAARQGMFGAFANRLRLWADDLMQPRALPFAGGLISAVVLFALLIPSFAFRPVAADAGSIVVFTEPELKGRLPFGFDSDTADFVV
jgi:anti-sigma factor RsiW